MCMWNVAREVQAGCFADMRIGFRVGLRGMCMLEQLLAECQVNLGCFYLTLAWCYFALHSFCCSSSHLCLCVAAYITCRCLRIGHHLWLIRCVLRLELSGAMLWVCADHQTHVSMLLFHTTLNLTRWPNNLLWLLLMGKTAKPGDEKCCVRHTGQSVICRHCDWVCGIGSLLTQGKNTRQSTKVLKSQATSVSNIKITRTSDKDSWQAIEMKSLQSPKWIKCMIFDIWVLASGFQLSHKIGAPLSGLYKKTFWILSKLICAVICITTYFRCVCFFHVNAPTADAECLHAFQSEGSDHGNIYSDVNCILLHTKKLSHQQKKQSGGCINLHSPEGMSNEPK